MQKSIPTSKTSETAEQKARRRQQLKIKEEIENIHKRSRGNAEAHRLLKQINQKFVPVVLNPLQMNMALCQMLGYKEINVEAGRGAGKSTGIANHSRTVVTDMPRSNNLLICSSFQQALTRTLPGTILGWENLGLFKDLHYFIGKRPPKSWKWPEPYQPPLDYKRSIFWWTGAVYSMVSQEVKDSGRGPNADSQLKDEAALLSWDKLEANTNPTQRGSNYDEFKNKKTFLSDLNCSTTPLTLMGKWFIDREELAYQDADKIRFLKATCEVNEENLPPDYLENARKGAIPWIYEAEYLNVRPRQVKEGFYPLLDEEHHAYTAYNYDHYQAIGQSIDCRGDADLNPAQPLTLGVDWGAAINCLAVLQHNRQEIKCLKSMFVLSDNRQTQDDLFRQFNDYYQYHRTKMVYLWYDNSGNNETGNTKHTRAMQAKLLLESLGWSVQLMTKGGRNPQHELKYMLWNLLLKGDHPFLPTFTINKPNCKELWVSMFNAQAGQDSQGRIKKVKTSEKSKKIQRQFATDLSDAIDAAIFGLYASVLDNSGGTLPPLRIGSR